MIRYFDASRVANDLIPVEVLAELHATLTREGIDYVLVGAAARDLAVHAPSGTKVGRATRDVDLAVAVEAGSQHDALLQRLGEPSSAPQRVHVLGVEVDVLPFAGAHTEILLGDATMDVTGLAEAAREPTRVKISEHLTVPVASLEAQVVLKLLAWRDRQQETQKDALDLGQILSASSCGLFEDQAWDDDDALLACEGDIILMGPYRAGRAARATLPEASALRVVAVLEDKFSDLSLQMGVREASELLDAFRRGFLARVESHDM